MDNKSLEGVIPAVVTPFKENGEVDLDGLRQLVQFLLSNGVHAIMTTGGNGEFCNLLREEKSSVIEHIVEEVAGSVPVIAGTAACSTMETILLSEDARNVKADAVIVTPPYFFKLPEESLYEHYQILSGRVDLPIIIYNNPSYTGNNLSPELIDRLADLNGIIGLKQSNSDLGQLVESVSQSADKISICTGIDSQFYPALCAGAKGIFSTAAAVIPKLMVQLYDLVKAGEHAEAYALHMNLQPLNHLFEYDPGYVSPCKEALKLLGLPGGPVRKPLPDLTAIEREAVEKALKALKLI